MSNLGRPKKGQIHKIWPRKGQTGNPVYNCKHLDSRAAQDVLQSCPSWINSASLSLLTLPAGLPSSFFFTFSALLVARKLSARHPEGESEAAAAREPPSSSQEDKLSFLDFDPRGGVQWHNETITALSTNRAEKRTFPPPPLSSAKLASGCLCVKYIHALRGSVLT